MTVAIPAHLEAGLALLRRNPSTWWTAETYAARMRVRPPAARQHLNALVDAGFATVEQDGFNRAKRWRLSKGSAEEL